MKFLLFFFLTVGFFTFASLLFPFAWSRKVRAFHLRVKLACCRVYYGKYHAT
jgi:hypothetical protein